MYSIKKWADIWADEIGGIVGIWLGSMSEIPPYQF